MLSYQYRKDTLEFFLHSFIPGHFSLAFASQLAKMAHLHSVGWKSKYLHPTKFLQNLRQASESRVVVKVSRVPVHSPEMKQLFLLCRDEEALTAKTLTAGLPFGDQSTLSSSSENIVSVY